MWIFLLHIQTEVDLKKLYQKIVFLDFDGVLNYIDFKPDYEIEGINKEDILCPKCIENLNYIIENTDADIVISSSWRLFFEIERLREILELCGFKFSSKVVDYTPQGAQKKLSELVYRGNEIEEWIQDNCINPRLNIVILDDNSDMEHLTKDLLQTDFYGEGLTKSIAKTAVERLNRQNNSSL